MLFVATYWSMTGGNYRKPAGYNPLMSPVLTIEQGRELVRLCRTGRLYEVDAWITSGKSLAVPSEIRTTPLRIAVDIGFHSLIRLLVCHEKDVATLKEALSDAVALRDLDAVILLLEHGADLRSVPLADVLLSWDPKLIQLFLDGDAEALEGLPFTVAFCAKVRTALRPFINFKHSHPDLEADLQEQLDRALRYFLARVISSG